MKVGPDEETTGIGDERMATVTKAQKLAWQKTPRDGVQSVRQHAHDVGKALGCSEHAVLVAALHEARPMPGELVCMRDDLNPPVPPDDPLPY